MKIERDWKYRWHMWYAWRPVFCDLEKTWIWFDWVERRRDTWPTYQYRIVSLTS